MSPRRLEEQELSRAKPRRPDVARSGAEHATPTSDLLTLQRAIGNRAVARVVTQAGQRVIQRDMIGGIDVNKDGRMPSWEQNGKWYHLNTTTDPYHVTEEGWSEGKKKKNVTKTHYFFKRPEFTCVNAVGTGGVPGSKKKFSELPKDVREFVNTYFDQLIG